MRHLSPKELRSLAAHCGGVALLLFFALFISQGGLERSAGTLSGVNPVSLTAMSWSNPFNSCNSSWPPPPPDCSFVANPTSVTYPQQINIAYSCNYSSNVMAVYVKDSNGNTSATNPGFTGDLQGRWLQGNYYTTTTLDITGYNLYYNYALVGRELPPGYSNIFLRSAQITVSCPAGQTRSGSTCVSSAPTAPTYLAVGICTVGVPMGFNWGGSTNNTSYAFRVDNTAVGCNGVTGGNNNVGCVQTTDYVEDNINRGEQTITILNPGRHHAWVHGVGSGGWSAPAESYFGCGCPAGQIQSGSSCITPAPASCSNGLNRASYPSCTCPSGQVQSGSSCITPEPTPTPTPTPSCSITPSPTSVTSPGSVTLNYTINNATAASITCTQNGGGTCPTPPAIAPSSGSISSGTLTNSTASAKTATYTISCSGAGSQSNVANVVVNPVAAPASCPANCPGSAAPNCTANAGYTYNSGSNTCTAIACPANCPGAGAGSCTANSGYTYNSSNNTCTAVAAPICANNLDYSLYGPSCTCPQNQVQAGSGCVAASCPNGLNITTYPLCACPSGQVQSGSTCINDIVQTGLSLTATPSRVHRGGSTTLTWSSNIGDTSCALTSSATGTTLSTLLSGTLTQTITRRTTFTLTCNSGNLRQSVSILPSFIEI